MREIVSINRQMLYTLKMNAATDVARLLYGVDQETLALLQGLPTNVLEELAEHPGPLFTLRYDSKQLRAMCEARGLTAYAVATLPLKAVKPVKASVESHTSGPPVKRIAGYQR